VDERDRAEMRPLCDQFKELMARGVETPPFDQAARVHTGEMIVPSRTTRTIGIRLRLVG
jgi:hypothetical protein